MTSLALLLCALSQRSVPGHPLILDASSDRFASEYVLVASGRTIHAFDRTAATWTRLNPPVTREPAALGIDEGIVWVAADSIFSADIRARDWRSAPGPASGLSFDDDYVWAATDSGLRRFDKYSETWETVSPIAARDVLAGRDGAWVVGFGPESPAPPRGSAAIFRHKDQLRLEGEADADRIVALPGRVWFLGQQHFTAFRRDNATWSRYDALPIEDWSALGDSLFAVAGNRVVMYDPAADAWAGFRDVAGLPEASGIFAGPQNLLIATAQGLVVFNRAERTTTRHDRSTGLLHDSLLDAWEDSRYIITVSRTDIGWYDKQTGFWKSEPLATSGTAHSRLLYLDDEGGHARLIPRTDLRLSGRAGVTLSAALSAAELTSANRKDVNLNLLGRHETGRSLSLFYDDSDRDEVRYGLGYHGLEPDVLQRLDAGFLETALYEFDLWPRFSTFGGSARFGFGGRAPGPNSEPAVRLGAQAGLVRSRAHTDYFYGRSLSSTVALPDVAYARGIIYRIPSDPRPLEPLAADTIFVDDRNPATDTIDTRRGISLAGITGDFDPLIRGQDYFLGADSRSVFLLTPRRPNDAVILVSGGIASVIQSDSTRGNAMENVYSFGSGIIPGSFDLTITDTAGAVHAPAEFGLDNNEDGQVDPGCINHDLGLLSFPAARPFPLPVYENSKHIYTLTTSFRTRTSSYTLSARPLVRMSEQVRVDGTALTRGADYVIDYTSGRLVFLRADIVSEVSRIEVGYSTLDKEVPRAGAQGTGASALRAAAAPLFWSVQPELALGQYVRLAPGIAAADTAAVGLLTGRIEAGSGRRSIRFEPEAAVDTAGNWATGGRLVAGYGIVGLSSSVRAFSPGFRHFGAAAREHGALELGGDLAASLEPLTGMRLEARLARDRCRAQDESGTGSKLGPSTSVSSLLGTGLSYSNPRLFSGRIGYSADDLPGRRHSGLSGSLSRDVELGCSRIKLSASVRTDVVDFDSSAGQTGLEYVLNTGLTLPLPLTADIYYRNSATRRSPLAARRSDDELRLRLNLDAIPGLYYTGSYDLSTDDSPLAGTRDLTFANTWFNNLQIAPGRWWSPLTLVNFTLGTTQSFDEYLRGLGPEYRRPLLIAGPLDTDISSLTRSSGTFGIVQLNPVPSLDVWYKRTWTAVGIGRFGPVRLVPGTEDQLRVEFRPRDLGVFMLSGLNRAARDYPTQLDRRIYLEWNNPWTRLLRTKLTTTWTQSRDDFGSAVQGSDEISPGLEAQLAFTPRDILRLGLALHRRSAGPTSTIALAPSAGLSLNLLRVLYLQLDYSSTFPFSSDPTHTATLRLTAQL